MVPGGVVIGQAAEAKTGSRAAATCASGGEPRYCSAFCRGRMARLVLTKCTGRAILPATASGTAVEG
eukprot:23951-Rhodomonas_salina.1